MNGRLKLLPDGAERWSNGGLIWFDCANSLIGRSKEYGEIYWPFAIHESGFETEEPTYSVTHLPSGYSAGKGLTRERALAYLMALRQLNADWTFTDVKSAKCKETCALARPIAQMYGAATEKKAKD